MLIDIDGNNKCWLTLKQQKRRRHKIVQNWRKQNAEALKVNCFYVQPV